MLYALVAADSDSAGDVVGVPSCRAMYSRSGRDVVEAAVAHLREEGEAVQVAPRAVAPNELAKLLELGVIGEVGRLGRQRLLRRRRTALARTVLALPGLIEAELRRD